MKVRLALIVVIVAAFVGIGMPSSHAARSLICNGNGRLEAVTQPNGDVDWTVAGSGSCFEPFIGTSQPRTLDFSGGGTSDSLGLCDGSLLVTNLDLTVVLNMIRTGDGTPDSEIETWSSPVSFFPLATPFLVNGLKGAGLSIHRIFLSCHAGGVNAAATFAWTRLLQ